MVSVGSSAWLGLSAYLMGLRSIFFLRIMQPLEVIERKKHPFSDHIHQIAKLPSGGDHLRPPIYLDAWSVKQPFLSNDRSRPRPPTRCRTRSSRHLYTFRIPYAFAIALR